MRQRTTNSSLPIATAALAAEPLFHVGGFPVTNSLVNGWIATGIFIVIAMVVSRRTSLVPRGVHNVFEALVTTMLEQIEQVTGDKQRAKMFFPIVATLFLFILVNNWLGLLPGTGTVGIYEIVHGELELVPLLRPATADLNLTLGMALFVVIATHVFAFRKLGVIEHGSKFFNVRGIFRALKKGPMAVLIAVIEFFVGFLEIIGEFSKTLSLSLRLFGNVFAGEILLGVMMGLVSVVVPIPFYFLEIMVGVIQATVFAMLTLIYLTVATSAHGHDDEEHGHHAPAHA